MAAVRTLTFAAGTASRNVARVALPNAVLSTDVVESLCASDDAAVQRTVLLPGAAVVWHAAMTRLCSRNSHVLEELMDSGGRLRLDAIRAVDWPSAFTPLCADDVRDLAASVPMSPDALHVRLAHVVDRGLLVYDNWSGAVYPQSLWQLTTQVTRRHWLRP